MTDVIAADPLVARLRAAGCVFAEDEAALLQEAGGADASAVEALAARRIAGEPLEQLLGWAEFAGLRIGTAPGVFVPRRRTELLLRLAAEAGEAAAARAADRVAAPLVLELCCGVAPIATALAATHPEWRILAADLDPDAAAQASRNLAPFGGAVYEGDLLTALPAGFAASLDVIAVNAPYVPTAEIANMPSEARDHEHLIALDGGDDGLVLHRRIAAEAPQWLAPGGVLVIETSRRQVPIDRAIFERHGWRVEAIEDDEFDATALQATRESARR